MIRRAIVYCVLYCMCEGAQGQVHKWIDANGVTHYGDRPPTSSKTEKVTIRENHSQGGDKVPKRDWVQVHENVVRTLWADKANIQLEGGYRLVWTIENYKGTTGKFQSMRILEKYDCQYQRSVTKSFAIFSGPMATGRLLREEKSNIEIWPGVADLKPLSKDSADAFAAICALRAN